MGLQGWVLRLGVLGLWLEDFGFEDLRLGDLGGWGLAGFCNSWLLGFLYSDAVETLASRLRVRSTENPSLARFASLVNTSGSGLRV